MLYLTKSPSMASYRKAGLWFISSIEASGPLFHLSAESFIHHQGWWLNWKVVEAFLFLTMCQWSSQYIWGLRAWFSPLHSTDRCCNTRLFSAWIPKWMEASLRNCYWKPEPLWEISPWCLLGHFILMQRCLNRTREWERTNSRRHKCWSVTEYGWSGSISNST